MRFFRDTTQGVAENISSDRFFRRLWGLPANVNTIRLTGRLTIPAHELPPRRSLVRRRARQGGPRFRTVLNLHLTPDRLAKELAVWETLRPYVLLAYPSMLRWICDEVESRGMEIPALPVAVVTMSETLSPATRDRVSRTFGCPVHGRYGSNEFSRLAGTLPGSLRYAFNPLLAYVEVLREDGSPAPAGDVGRIVLTDLNSYVMPFIRYDIGDLARVSEDGYIGGFRLIEEILGRTTDAIRLPSGRLVGIATLHNIMFRANDFEPHIRAYQCAQIGPNELELRVVWRNPPTEALRGKIASALASWLEPDTVVRVKDVLELDRLPSGKEWIVRREF